MSLKFAFIGAGNVATHLAKSLQMNGFMIVQIYSRTMESAESLAKILQTDFTTSPEKITTTADVYIVAVKDDALENVLSKINFQNKLVVHCSGSMPLAVLEKYSKNFGVFYPLQTFSKQREVNFREIPVFIEANSTENEKILFEIADKISGKVSVLNSEKRKYLHISAVFACNFVNHFYTVAAEILKSQEIPFDVIKPLITETAAKVQVMQPFDAQTGPAVRFDENVISNHLNELEGFNDYQKLYNSISKSIFEHHKKTDNGFF